MGLVVSVAFDMTFWDVSSGEIVGLHPEKYWKAGGDKVHRVVLASLRLIRFVVLDVELREDGRADGSGGGGDGTRVEERKMYKGPKSNVAKYAAADVTVVRESDFGVNDDCFTCFSHMGNWIQAGDVVLGYDLTTSIISDDDTALLGHNFDMPDVVLVKKCKVTSKRDDTTDTSSTKGEKPERSKSSKSKKREKRMRKEKKKMEEMEESWVRMGFAENDTNLDKEKAEWEDEIENDPDLKREMELAEQQYLSATAQADADDSKNITEPAQADDDDLSNMVHNSEEEKSSVDDVQFNTESKVES